MAGAWKTDFVFDGLGRRRIERDYAWQSGSGLKTNELHFIYDGWLLVQVRDGSNNVLLTYTRGLDLSGSLAGAGGIGGLLARTDGNGSTFYHADGAGNITALMDGQQNMAARYMYSAFGRSVGQWGPMAPVNHIMFSSKEHFLNAEDIYDYGGRDWFTRPGRWGSRDPMGESGDLNLYRGMFNSPLNVVDRDGDDNYLPGGENSTAGLSFSMQLPTPVVNPTPPSMGPFTGPAVPINQSPLPNPSTYDALLIGAPDLVGTPIGYDLAQGNALSYLTAPGTEMAVGGLLGKLGTLAKCPSKNIGGLTADQARALEDALKKIPGVQEAQAFGSRTTGAFSSGSDLDIAVYPRVDLESPDALQAIREAQAIARETGINPASGNPLDIHSFENADQMFREFIRLQELDPAVSAGKALPNPVPLR